MPSPNEAAPNALTTTQRAIAIGMGVTLWFLAALLMRAIEPLGAFHGGGMALLYALVVPGTAPFVLLIRRLARLRRDQTVLAVTIATGAAGLLDGLALRLMPNLYGADTAGAGAAILWGAGVALILGVVMSTPRKS